MSESIKAELRKLFSIRSTYILSGIALLYMLLFDFLIVGYKGGFKRDSIHLDSPIFLLYHLVNGFGAPILFGSIIAVLLMAHEYRYNTIMYTLTISNSRSKTLLAKIIAVSCFALLFGAFVEVLSPSLILLGLWLHHYSLVQQVFLYRQYIWRGLFYAWAYGMIGLLLALFFRNLVASIIALLIIPIVVEPLIGLLLTSNEQQYMPFTALSSVLTNGITGSTANQISAGRSALVVIGYLVAGWIVAWMLFLKRDAN